MRRNFLVLNLHLLSLLVLVFLIFKKTEINAADVHTKPQRPWNYTNKAEIVSRLLKSYNHYKETHGVLNLLKSKSKSICDLNIVDKKILCKELLLKHLKLTGTQAKFKDDTKDSILQKYECQNKKIMYSTSKKKESKKRKRSDKQKKFPSVQMPAFYCPVFIIIKKGDKKPYPSIPFFVSDGDKLGTALVHKLEIVWKPNGNAILWYYELDLKYEQHIPMTRETDE